MSEYERPDRFDGDVTVDDVRQLMGASTPHFALQLRNRIQTLISGLLEDHPARIEGEREIARLNDVALGAERRGAAGDGEPPMPSLREAGVGAGGLGDEPPEATEENRAAFGQTPG